MENILKRAEDPSVQGKEKNVYAAYKKVEEIHRVMMEDEAPRNYNLFGGALGTALFLTYYYEYHQDIRSLEKAVEIVENATMAINFAGAFRGYSMSSGLAGYCWLIQHLNKKDHLEFDADQLLHRLEEILFNSAKADLSIGNYDYLHGAIGAGFYFLSKPDIQNVLPYIEQLIDDLERSAIKDMNGVRKWPSFDIMTRQIDPATFNLGLSHGIPSILLFLVKAYERGVKPELTREMIMGTATFLLSTTHEDIKLYNCYYPSQLSDKDPGARRSRLSWCYGDLGVGYALWKCSKTMNDDPLGQKALEVFRYASTRLSLEDNYVRDAGLCHGAAGIYHIFNKMFRETGDPDLLSAAEYWLSKTLIMDTFPDGAAGYKSFHIMDEVKWRADLGFLEGIAGIGLALLSTDPVTSIDWDEILFIA